MQRPFVKLFPSTDNDGSTIYVGRWCWPGKLDFSKGMAFIIYVEPGKEELHFCPLASPDLNNVFDYYDEQRKSSMRNKNPNLTVLLEPRYETHGEKRKFYIGKLQFNGELDCGVNTSGNVFLVFLADEGEEELQIGIINPDKIKKKKPEIINAKNKYKHNI